MDTSGMLLPAGGKGVEGRATRGGEGHEGTGWREVRVGWMDSP